MSSKDFVTLIPEALDPCAVAPLLCGRLSKLDSTMTKALIVSAGITMYGAIKKLGMFCGRNDWVAIVGAGGGLGHLYVCFIYHFHLLRLNQQGVCKLRKYWVTKLSLLIGSFYTCLCFGISSSNQSSESKRGICLDSGASEFVDFSVTDVWSYPSILRFIVNYE